jgi:hypothetical protein
MRKAIIGSLAVLAIAVLAWASSDPWKDKPFQQWDEKDVQKVLSSSPWSKIVQTEAGPSGGAVAPSSLPQANPGTPGAGSGGGRGGMGGGSSSSPSGGGGAVPATGADNSTSQASFAVRWGSSRTMREAFLRSKVLSGKSTEEDAEQQLAQPPAAYLVVISGQQMMAFQAAEEAGVKAASTLTTKKGKQKIEASNVEFQRGSDGKALLAIVISFPKRTATGEATIDADEKGAEFSCLPGRVSIKVSFDFSKMYDAQGRDL